MLICRHVRTYIAEQLAGLACFGAEQHRDDGFRLGVGGVLVDHVHLRVKASHPQQARSNSAQVRKTDECNGGSE